tara:strand:- start:206 stop:586 length:381 start_codon:yes stop_codon:yes gene_type:complete
LSKQRRHRLIQWYIKNHYWYTQGSNVWGSVKIVTIVEVLGLIAFTKYMWENPPWIALVIIGALWFPARTAWYWGIGKFWHDNEGYESHTAWNEDKVPPGRMKVINVDELADAILKRVKERFDGEKL